jgi:hypothetical protein
MNDKFAERRDRLMPAEAPSSGPSSWSFPPPYSEN